MADTDTFINETSKSVRGIYTLDTPIHIRTVSGSIDIDVKLPTRTLSNLTWRIDLSSVSGSIKLRTQLLDPASKTINAPDFVTELGSVSGSVRADIHHSKGTYIKATSGRHFGSDLHDLLAF